MKNRPLCSVCLLVFILLCICIWVGGDKFLKELRPSPLEKKVREDEMILFTGRVYQKEIKEKYQVLYLKNISVIYQQQSLKESKIIVYDKNKIEICIGDIITGNGVVSFFESARNPGNFDQKLYYQKQDIHASVWAEEVKVTKNSVYPLRNKLYELRKRWSIVLYEAMGEKDGATFSAILLGEKNGMARELKKLYQVNGIAHILAISGIHLSLIGVGMYQLLRRITGSYPAGGTLGIIFLLSYIFMVGFTVSAVRALVMFLFRVGADMAGRHYDSPTALSLAAVIVLVWRPLYIFDGGFWMSFGAVLATIIVLPAFEYLPLKGVTASIGINLVLLPILLYYFYEVPVYSVILNLLVIPMLTVLLMVGLIGSVAWLIYAPLGYLILGLCRGIFRLYEWCCYRVIDFPGARLVTGQPELWEIGLYYVFLAGAVALIRWNRGNKKVENCSARRWKGIMSAVIICGCVLLLTAKNGRTEEIQITMLDVGQGDSVFLKDTEGMTYLIDGGSSDVSKVGEYRMESYFLWKGVDKLDYVFVSHGDADHLNGIEEMLDRQKIGVKIGTLVLPSQSVWDESILRLAQKAKENKVRVLVMTGGDVLKGEKLSITCIQPEENLDSEFKDMEIGNAASMVLKVSFGAFDMLLTGDVEGKGEELLSKNLKEQYAGTTWEILKVAHHGSKNSTSEQFLEIVKPKYSLISAGIDNRYGHPHEEAVKRLKKAGSRIYSTQDNGAIMIRVKEGKMYVEGYMRATVK